MMRFLERRCGDAANDRLVVANILARRREER
jgi:hypothetical protein